MIGIELTVRLQLLWYRYI